jgi:hypothetical protein
MSYDVVHSICELKLPTEYKKEWREVQDGYRQAADEHIQDLAKQQKEFFQCMSEQCEKHMQLVSVSGVHV